MNFLKILKSPGKYNLRDIASEIIAIENQLPEFKEGVKKADAAIVELRKTKLGGGQVSDKDLDHANKTLAEAQGNVKALESAHDDLEEELTRAAEAKLENDKKSLENNSTKLAKEEQDLNQQFAETAAFLKALLVELEGDIHLKGPHIFNLDLSRFKAHNVFTEKLKRLLEKQQHPTLYEKKRKLEGQQNRLREHSVKEIIEQALGEVTAFANNKPADTPVD